MTNTALTNCQPRHLILKMAMRGRAEEARSQGVLDKRDRPVGGRTWNFYRCRQYAEGDGFALARLNECDRQGVQVHVFPPHCCKNSIRASTNDTTSGRPRFRAGGGWSRGSHPSDDASAVVTSAVLVF